MSGGKTFLASSSQATVGAVFDRLTGVYLELRRIQRTACLADMFAQEVEAIGRVALSVDSLRVRIGKAYPKEASVGRTERTGPTT